jgi:uncharacterized protein YjdB
MNANFTANSGLATGIAAGTAGITATLAGKSGSANLTVTDVTLSSIAVTPANASVASGITKQFTAIGIFSDGTSEDITDSVTWSSDNETVATINASGLATGVAAGTAGITATLGATSGSANLTVTDATLSSIAVTPANSSVVSGLAKQFTATGTYSDGTSEDITALVTWASGDITVATMNANFTADSGLATGVAAGTAVITATLGATSGSANLTVTAATLSSIAVTPTNSSVVSGLAKQFTATGTYSDGTSENITALVTWASGDITVATMNANFTANSGLATGIAAGTAVITATLGATSGSANLTVTDATLSSIAVTPANSSVVSGLTKQFTATGTYSDGTSENITALVTWASGDITVATMNANFTANSGLATGIAAGTAEMSATLAGKSGSTNLTVTAATLSSIAVTPINPSVVSGLTRQFTATGTYSDGSVVNITALATWASDDITVATMNANFTANSGLATGVAPGTAGITATLDGKSGSTNLTVTAATLSSIAVTPINPSVVSGQTRQFAATGTYSDGSVADITALVIWSSDDITVATMNANFTANSGLATGVAPGTAGITATLSGKSGSTNLTVTAATLSFIAVTPIDPSVASGLTKQFTATGTYSDGSVVNITDLVIWSSADTDVATMNPNFEANSGLATGVTVGSSLITATLGSESGNTTLTVTAALADNPTAPALGETERFLVIASQAITTTSGSALADGDLAILDQARSFYAGFTVGAVAGEFVELTNGISFAPDDVTPPYVIPEPYASTVAFINQVRTDLGIAYTFLAADPNPGAPTQVCPIELGGETLTRGVYKTALDVTIQTGNLTLDAEGDPDSVWIFSIDGNLTTGAPGGSINLIGGAQAKNVYWRTAGVTTIATGTSFQGNVFSWPQINVRTDADVIGRLFSVTEQVTLESNAVTKAQ